jgi:predicted dehydrogenase
MDKIRVGIIGASSGGWASIGHIPALQALPQFDLRAVGTSRRESARRAAEEYGAAHAFDNYRDLVEHPEVDLVVVAVKVTDHHELVTAALEAGKAVYSEWPLGVDLAEAADLAARAEKAKVRTAIGLQARFSPEIRTARDLIADGYVGEVLGTTLIGSGMAWTGETDSAHAYFFDDTAGATALSVPSMHALDAMEFVLGPFTRMSAELVTARTSVHVRDTGAAVAVTAPDQIAVSGTLARGAAASLYYRGGHSRGQNLRWEINGTEGDLVLSAPGINGNIQVVDLRLEGGRGADTEVSEIRVPDTYTRGIARDLTGPARNVALLYTQLAEDLRDGTATVPGFAHALDRHRQLDTIRRAAHTGTAQKLD